MPASKQIAKMLVNSSPAYPHFVSTRLLPATGGSVAPLFESGVDLVICFGQQDINKGDPSRGLCTNSHHGNKPQLVILLGDRRERAKSSLSPQPTSSHLQYRSELILDYPAPAKASAYCREQLSQP